MIGKYLYDVKNKKLESSEEEGSDLEESEQQED